MSFRYLPRRRFRTMSLLRKRKYGVVLTVAALMVCAICARVVARYGYHAEVLGIVWAVIYMGLLAVWAAIPAPVSP